MDNHLSANSDQATMTQRIVFFAFSLVLNSLGNVLTIVTSSHVHPSYLGAAYWTAAETI